MPFSDRTARAREARLRERTRARVSRQGPATEEEWPAGAPGGDLPSRRPRAGRVQPGRGGGAQRP
ncbi:MAG: hypothetical protein ACYDA6_06960, partial [Solirubrobacteraceae bacterium]